MFSLLSIAISIFRRRASGNLHQEIKNQKDKRLNLFFYLFGQEASRLNTLWQIHQHFK